MRTYRDGGPGGDGDGHVLETAGNDGDRRVVIVAVDGEEPRESIDGADRRQGALGAQAGPDHLGSFTVVETVAVAEHGEAGQGVGPDLADYAEGPACYVIGVPFPGTPAPDSQLHDVAGWPDVAQVAIGHQGRGERVRLVVDRDAELARLGVRRLGCPWPR